MDLEHYKYTMALCTNGTIYFIAYLNYALWFLNSYLPEKWNLEIDLLQIYKGGLNSRESWLRSYISLIDKGSQSCTEFLPGMHQYILKWVDLLQKRREFNSRGHIKNIKTAWTKANAEKFKLN